MSLQETDDAQLFAKQLSRWRLVYLHVANEGMYTKLMLARLIREGLKPGAPDYFVFTPARDAPRGCVIELKKSENSYAKPSQKRWIKEMEALGWRACVCYGWEHAIDQMKAWGYGDAR